MKNRPKKVLGIFQIVMINIIAVDSIRTLPFAAEYGLSLIFFYLLAGILFFIPTAFVSAELGTTWPKRGGIYVWVREAFGKKWALIIIWLDWIYNIFWYPTILALLAGAFAYIFNPDLANNKYYMVCTITGLFWIATILNCRGMKLSSYVSSFGALIGTLLPMALIILMAIFWFGSGKPLQIEFTWNAFFPHLGEEDKLSFISTVLFGLLGLEMVATHALEMQRPKKDYPKALFLSVLIILLSIIFSSLAIAMTVPAEKLSLVTGILQAFTVFLTNYHLPAFVPIMAIFIILGGFSGVSAWIIGPTKGLLVASEDGLLPKYFGETSKRGVPTRILIAQAIIVTIISFAYVLMPTINSSFWLLSNITAELAMITYMGLFASAIKLHYSKRNINRPYKIPFGTPGKWLIAGVGFLSCICAFFMGLLPPPTSLIKDVWLYEVILIGGMVILISIPFLHRTNKTNY